MAVTINNQLITLLELPWSLSLAWTLDSWTFHSLALDSDLRTWGNFLHFTGRITNLQGRQCNVKMLDRLDKS